MRKIETERLPIFCWADYMEDGTEKQARNLALHPYTFEHIVMLSDCHQGYGMPIGGVVAVNKMIIPSSVGVDIGCGVSAIRTTLTSINRDTLQDVVDSIKKIIPVGFDHRAESLIDKMPGNHQKNIIVEKEFDSACHQLGTLGGGK